MRSFDRIALTQDIIDQQHQSGVNAPVAVIALDLELNGVDFIKDNSFTVSSLPTGDSLDLVAHQPKRDSKAENQNLGTAFSWDGNATSDAKQQHLSQLLSDFQGAAEANHVSGSIAEHGMMTGQNVFDQAWKGDDQAAVKNFVSEELYIHSKVALPISIANRSS